MKKFGYTILFSVLVFFFKTTTLYAQSVEGRWEGALNVSGSRLRLVFNIERKDDRLQATLDSPDQGVRGIPVDSLQLQADSLFLYLPRIGASYKGRLNTNGSEITGNWKQGGASLPLNMQKTENEEVLPDRPQHPSEPYPYLSEEVKFQNKEANIQLAGTFTRPKGEGQFPAVILVSGSGPQDRDETILDHKPFLVIADYLSRQGIAVLRYDDRGFAESGGTFATATSAEFASDAAAAFDYLQYRSDVQANNIGILGHSEGGLIAPMVAQQGKPLSFVILLAAPAIPGHELIQLQSERILERQGMDKNEIQRQQKMQQELFQILMGNATSEEAAVQLQQIFRAAYDSLPQEVRQQQPYSESQVQTQISGMVSPWYRNLLRTDPKAFLQELEAPTLALYGGKDLQVPADINAAALQTLAEENQLDNIQVKVFPELNHLFQPAQSGLPNEYGQIETTIDPQVLEYIANWLKEQLPQLTE